MSIIFREAPPNDKLWGASRIAAMHPTRATCYVLILEMAS